MIYLSIITKLPYVIVQKDLIEVGEKLKYTLQIIKRKPGSPANQMVSLPKEIKSLIDEKMNNESYSVLGKETDYHIFEKKEQFKIICLVYEDPKTGEFRRCVITNAILFVMNNDGKTIDTVSCLP